MNAIGEGRGLPVLAFIGVYPRASAVPTHQTKSVIDIELPTFVPAA